jgi:peptide/nickel transport system substrate-binding protein
MKKACRTIIYMLICLMLTSCQTGYELEQLQKLHEKYDTAAERSKSVIDFDVLDSGPVKGGTLKLFTTEPDTLNPILTKNTYTADVVSFIYEGLTRLDKNQRAVPVLSDSWTVSEDGLIWNFHIREGVKWHDGEPFTAYDAEFTIQTIQIPSVNSVYKPLLLNISSCMAVDSSTLKIALKKPNSFLPEMMNFPILPKHKFISMDVLTSAEEFDPVGTGPYRLDKYTPGEKITLSLNNDWWYMKENPGISTDGMYLSTVQAKIIKSADDAMESFQAGDVDIAGIPVNEYYKYKGRTDLTIKKYTSRNFEFIAFNLKDPVFTDIYARKAISMAIDRDRIISELLPGEAEAADLPVLPGSWISDLTGVTAQTILDIGSVTENDVAGTSSVNAGKEANKQTDKDDAKEDELSAAKTPEDILTVGGWKGSKQGYYKVIKGVRRYLKVEMLVNSNNALRVKAAQMVCAQLEEAGIPAKLVQVEWDELLKKVDTGKFNMVFMGCRVPQIPDISFMYSDGYLPEGYSANVRSAYNVAGYSNEHVNAYIIALFNENDTNRKKAIYKAFKEQIETDCPYVGMYFLRDSMIYSKEIKGQIAPDTWNRFNDMYQWYKPVAQ